jgi:putative transposase
MPTIRQKQSTYAITILTFQRHRHFQRTANAELFIATLLRHRDKSRFQLHGFVVMPDHTHILIWHTGYHEHRIRDADDFNNQLLYIQNNPTRKQYENYPHVHTKYPDRIDPIPRHLFP